MEPAPASSTPAPVPGPPAAGAWRQRTWDELLARIEDGKVIPIVGPELVLVQRRGAAVPLGRYVALELADRLELPPERVGAEPSLNRVMCVYFEHLPPGETRTTPYTLVPDILRQAKFEPPAPLRPLAEITAFTLFVPTTFHTLPAAAPPPPPPAARHPRLPPLRPRALRPAARRRAHRRPFRRPPRHRDGRLPIQQEG